MKTSFKYYFNKKDANGKVLIDPLNSSFFLSLTVPGEVLNASWNILIQVVMFVEYLLTLKRLSLQ